MAQSKRQIGSRRRNRSARSEIPNDKKTSTQGCTTKKGKEDRLKELARGIDQRIVDIETRNIEVVALHKQAEALMNELGLQEFYVSRVGTHKIEQKKGNDKHTIDVRKFRKEVTVKEFMDMVTVSKKAAEEVLPKKIINSITDTVTGVMKDPVYSFVPAGSKR